MHACGRSLAFSLRQAIAYPSRRIGRSIMTCPANGVEKAWLFALGHRAKIEQDGPVLNPRHHGRVASPQGSSPRRLGARSGRIWWADTHDHRWNRLDRHTSSPDERLGSDDRGFRPSSSRRHAAKPLGTSSSWGSGMVNIFQSGTPPASFAPSRIRSSVTSSAARVILSTRRARMSGSDSIRPITSAVPTMIPHCGPPRSLSPEKSTRSAPWQCPRPGGARSRHQAAAPAPGHPTRCRRS